jgi:hypothetical protein
VSIGSFFGYDPCLEFQDIITRTIFSQRRSEFFETRYHFSCFFSQILRHWLHRGIIDDPGKDFFVEDNEVIERAVLPLEYSGTII